MNRDYLKYFPKYEPYPKQMEAMDAIQEALNKKQIVLFEGACGTGKTLAALIPAVSVAKYTQKLIVVATNVNEQKQAFITEARKLHEKAKLRIVVMGAKMAACYFNKILEEDEDKITYSSCQKMRDNLECRPYSRVKGEAIGKESEGEAKHTAATLYLQFEQWLFSSVRTPTEIAEWGVKNEACSYKLALTALGKCDIVICDIRMILNPRFMPVLEFHSGKNLQGMILICDEAHNIGQIAKDVYKRGISESTLSESLDEIAELEIKTRNLRGEEVATLDLDRSKTFIKDVLLKSLQSLKIPADANEDLIPFADPHLPFYERPDQFLDNILENTKEFIQTERHMTANDSQVLDELMKKLDNILRAGFMKTRLEQNIDPAFDDVPACVTVTNFFYDYLEISKKNGYWPYLSIKTNRKGEITRYINIHLSLPEIITAPIFEAVYAAVLMSATLAPFDKLKGVLGIKRETVEQQIGLQFPIKNRKTYVVLRDVEYDHLAKAPEFKYPPDTLTANNTNNPASIKYIRDSLDAIIGVVHHNVLIYFTNKSQAEHYYLELMNKYVGRVLLDPGGKKTDEIKNRFFEMGEKHERGILCTYIRGTLAEGVDFKDYRARVVVIVGIGYTKGNAFVTADETAYKIKFEQDNVYDLVVQIPTIHKVRQAMGRVIRGNDDYGVRILLDARYKQSKFGYKQSKFDLSVHNRFPVEESREFHNLEVKRLRDTVRRDFAMWQ